MRILIVSVTTGHGHNSTAAAIADGFKERGHEVVIQDLYEYCSPFMYNAMDKGYLFSIKHMKRQFAQTYNMMESSEWMHRMAVSLCSNSILCKKFAQFFDGYSPDAVIATHVLSAHVLDELKRQGTITAPTVGVNTDYCILPFWEYLNHLDYIVTASELLTHSALARGIAPHRLLPFGLPVRAPFKRHTPKEEARQLLGLADRRTVLIMGGSMGYGNIAEAVAEMLSCGQELQLLCICGNNDKLAEELQELHSPALKVYGFVDKVDLLMDAADCIVTKPGGLTVTELLCKQLPAILINPIPGQEERNSEFLTNIGGAMRVTDTFSLSSAMHFLFSDPRRLELMRQSLALVAHPDATDRLCDFILGLATDRLPDDETASS